ncbi:putative group II intron-encoded protein LtrA [Operophtera brumata]|uniref:Putative group II intron-encoded protein LtrA n=1 Tax=Operophtera brumata TaxID=104452 RepID=A0A0L7LNX7_OPEBR|nr:putative group II intron-encoded protein LtrA [Operophtera brumata]
MDNPLTPNKIRRLLHFAEDKSFNNTRRLLQNVEANNKYLHLIGFQTAAFNPGEMTGRSTGADEIPVLGHHTLALDSLTNQMDKQTCEIQDIMRHSITTDYSFQHKVVSLTADEASFMRREAPLPVQNNAQLTYGDMS